MRVVPLLLGLLLATALVSLAPSAQAGPVDGGCIQNDLVWLCTDPCAYQSDCCAATGNVWCPEYPPE